jgi:hypothetical protein
VLIRHLWQLKKVVFLIIYLVSTVLLNWLACHVSPPTWPRLPTLRQPTYLTQPACLVRPPTWPSLPALSAHLLDPACLNCPPTYLSQPAFPVSPLTWPSLPALSAHLHDPACQSCQPACLVVTPTAHLFCWSGVLAKVIISLEHSTSPEYLWTV